MIEDQIKNVMSQVFGIEASSIGPHTSPDNVDTWDSIGQLNLIVALEEAFSVQFDNQQVTEMLNYPLVLDTVRQNLANKK